MKRITKTMVLMLLIVLVFLNIGIAQPTIERPGIQDEGCTRLCQSGSGKNQNLIGVCTNKNIGSRPTIQNQDNPCRPQGTSCRCLDNSQACNLICREYGFLGGVCSPICWSGPYLSSTRIDEDVCSSTKSIRQMCCCVGADFGTLGTQRAFAKDILKSCIQIRPGIYQVHISFIWGGTSAHKAVVRAQGAVQQVFPSIKFKNNIFGNLMTSSYQSIVKGSDTRGVPIYIEIYDINGVQLVKKSTMVSCKSFELEKKQSIGEYIKKVREGDYKEIIPITRGEEREVIEPIDKILCLKKNVDDKIVNETYINNLKNKNTLEFVNEIKNNFGVDNVIEIPSFNIITSEYSNQKVTGCFIRFKKEHYFYAVNITPVVPSGHNSVSIKVNKIVTENKIINIALEAISYLGNEQTASTTFDVTKAQLFYVDFEGFIPKIYLTYYNPVVNFTMDKFNSKLNKNIAVENSIVILKGQAGAYDSHCVGVKSICSKYYSARCRKHLFGSSCPHARSGYRVIKDTCGAGVLDGILISVGGVVIGSVIGSALGGVIGSVLGGILNEEVAKSIGDEMGKVLAQGVAAKIWEAGKLSATDIGLGMTIASYISEKDGDCDPWNLLGDPDCLAYSLTSHPNAAMILNSIVAAFQTQVGYSMHQKITNICIFKKVYDTKCYQVVDNPPAPHFCGNDIPVPYQPDPNRNELFGVWPCNYYCSRGASIIADEVHVSIKNNNLKLNKVLKTDESGVFEYRFALPKGVYEVEVSAIIPPMKKFAHKIMRVSHKETLYVEEVVQPEVEVLRRDCESKISNINCIEPRIRCAREDDVIDYLLRIYLKKDADITHKTTIYRINISNIPSNWIVDYPEEVEAVEVDDGISAEVPIRIIPSNLVKEEQNLRVKLFEPIYSKDYVKGKNGKNLEIPLTIKKYVPKAPSMEFYRDDKKIEEISGPINYPQEFDLVIKNNDDEYCDGSVFTLVVGAPPNWKVEVVDENNKPSKTFELMPKKTKKLRVKIIPSISKTGNYKITFSLLRGEVVHWIKDFENVEKAEIYDNTLFFIDNKRLIRLAFNRDPEIVSENVIAFAVESSKQEDIPSYNPPSISTDKIPYNLLRSEMLPPNYVDGAVMLYPEDGIVACPADWWNCKWKKRIPIEIRDIGALKGFWLKLEIPVKPEMKDDLSDIRFVDDENKELDFYAEKVERQRHPGSTDKVRAAVKLPIRQGSTITIYMYYDNENAQKPRKPNKEELESTRKSMCFGKWADNICCEVSFSGESGSATGEIYIMWSGIATSATLIIESSGIDRRHEIYLNGNLIGTTETSENKGVCGIGGTQKFIIKPHLIKQETNEIKIYKTGKDRFSLYAKLKIKGYITPLSSDDELPTYKIRDVESLSLLSLSGNLISLPINPREVLKVSKIINACGGEVYNVSGAKLEPSKVLKPGVPYFAIVKQRCTIPVDGSEISIHDINANKKIKIIAGKTYFGSLSKPVRYNDIRGTCRATSPDVGPFVLNPITGLWEYTSVLEPGYGYMMKTTKKCKFMTCDDDDRGYEPTIPGKTIVEYRQNTIKQTKTKDVCIDEYMLREYYCDGTEKYGNSYVAKSHELDCRAYCNSLDKSNTGICETDNEGIGYCKCYPKKPIKANLYYLYERKGEQTTYELVKRTQYESIMLASNLNSPFDVGINSNRVYWAEKDAIKSISKSGGKINTVIEGSIVKLYVDDSTLYYIEKGAPDEWSMELLSAKGAVIRTTEALDGLYAIKLKNASIRYTPPDKTSPNKANFSIFARACDTNAKMKINDKEYKVTEEWKNYSISDVNYIRISTIDCVILDAPQLIVSKFNILNNPSFEKDTINDIMKLELSKKNKIYRAKIASMPYASDLFVYKGHIYVSTEKGEIYKLLENDNTPDLTMANRQSIRDVFVSDKNVFWVENNALYSINRDVAISKKSLEFELEGYGVPKVKVTPTLGKASVDIEYTYKIEVMREDPDFTGTMTYSIEVLKPETWIVKAPEKISLNPKELKQFDIVIKPRESKTGLHVLYLVFKNDKIGEVKVPIYHHIISFEFKTPIISISPKEVTQRDLYLTTTRFRVTLKNIESIGAPARVYNIFVNAPWPSSAPEKITLLPQQTASFDVEVSPNIMAPEGRYKIDVLASPVSAKKLLDSKQMFKVVDDEIFYLEDGEVKSNGKIIAHKITGKDISSFDVKDDYIYFAIDNIVYRINKTGIGISKEVLKIEEDIKHISVDKVIALVTSTGLKVYKMPLWLEETKDSSTYEHEFTHYSAEEVDGKYGKALRYGGKDRDAKFVEFRSKDFDFSEKLHLTFDQGQGDVIKINTIKGKIHNAKWVEGKQGKALYFNGNAYVEIPEFPGLKLKDFMLSAWIKVDELSGKYAIIARGEDLKTDNMNYEMFVGYSHGQKVIGCAFEAENDKGIYFVHPISPELKQELLNSWIHVKCVYKQGESADIYINDKKVDTIYYRENEQFNSIKELCSKYPSDCIPSHQASSPLYIGVARGRRDYGGELVSFFKGAIDEVVISNVIPRNKIGLEAWIYPEKFNENECSNVVADYIIWNYDDTYSLRFKESDLEFIIGNRILSYDKSKIKPHTWTKIKAIYDGKKMKMFINNVLVSEKQISGNIISTPSYSQILRIGSDETNCRLFQGIIDEVKVYTWEELDIIPRNIEVKDENVYIISDNKLLIYYFDINKLVEIPVEGIKDVEIVGDNIYVLANNEIKRYELVNDELIDETIIYYADANDIEMFNTYIYFLSDGIYKIPLEMYVAKDTAYFVVTSEPTIFEACMPELIAKDNIITSHPGDTVRYALSLKLNTGCEPLNLNFFVHTPTNFTGYIEKEGFETSSLTIQPGEEHMLKLVVSSQSTVSIGDYEIDVIATTAYPEVDYIFSNLRNVYFDTTTNTLYVASNETIYNYKTLESIVGLRAGEILSFVVTKDSIYWLEKYGIPTKYTIYKVRKDGTGEINEIVDNIDAYENSSIAVIGNIVYWINSQNQVKYSSNTINVLNINNARSLYAAEDVLYIATNNAIYTYRNEINQLISGLKDVNGVTFNKYVFYTTDHVIGIVEEIDSKMISRPLVFGSPESVSVGDGKIFWVEDGYLYSISLSQRSDRSTVKYIVKGEEICGNNIDDPDPDTLIDFADTRDCCVLSVLDENNKPMIGRYDKENVYKCTPECGGYVDPECIGAVLDPNNNYKSNLDYCDHCVLKDKYKTRICGDGVVNWQEPYNEECEKNAEQSAWRCEPYKCIGNKKASLETCTNTCLCKYAEPVCDKDCGAQCTPQTVSEDCGEGYKCIDCMCIKENKIKCEKDGIQSDCDITTTTGVKFIGIPEFKVYHFFVCKASDDVEQCKKTPVCSSLNIPGFGITGCEYECLDEVNKYYIYIQDAISDNSVKSAVYEYQCPPDYINELLVFKDDFDYMTRDLNELRTQFNILEISAETEVEKQRYVLCKNIIEEIELLIDDYKIAVDKVIKNLNTFKSFETAKEFIIKEKRGTKMLIDAKLKKISAFDCMPTLVSYWKLDEGVGNIVNDELGKHQAIISGDVAWTTECISGNCLYFDGKNNGYVEVSMPPSGTFDAFTMSAWVKLTGVGYSPILGWLGFWIGIVQNDNNIRFEFFDMDKNHVSCIKTLSYNTWYHIVGTWNGKEIVLYINGNEVCRKSTPKYPLRLNNFYIGSYVFEGIHEANAIIDEVKFWNYALRQEEVQREYSQFSSA